MAAGLKTTDGIEAQKLYTEHARSVEMANERGATGFKDLLCAPTIKKTVKVWQNSMRFRKGAEHASPEWRRMAYREIDLTAPQEYTLAEGFTQQAFDLGVESEEVRNQHQEALAAFYRLQQEVPVSAIMTDGGYWDAGMTLAPPAYKENSFATTEDHYLAYNVAGVPLLAHFTAGKLHIIEHGYGIPQNGGHLVAWLNSTTAALIENKAEWATTANYVGTPVIERLQASGLWPSGLDAGDVLTVAGVPVLVEDWVPANYIVMQDIAVPGKPLRWREPEGESGRRPLQMVKDESFEYLITDYRTYTSANVVHRGSGCVIYLSSGTYASPTFDI